MCRTLGRADIDCIEACDGTHALELLESVRFDLVITDQWMPNMTGVELVRAIRATPRFADLPVLAVTADTHAEACDEFVQAGSTACLMKPFSQDELFSKVSELLRR